ncbi:MAG TPA: hypothetical protein ACFE0H_07450 [Elainellaceae cyanobacterium]
MAKPSTETMSSKLLDVDSELASREAMLAAQLEAVQEKRKSLQTVIHMFAAPGESLPSSISLEALTSNNGFSAESPAETPAPSDEKAPDKPKSQKTKQNKTIPQRSESKSNRQSTKTPKASSKPQSKSTSKKSTDWQPYVRKEFRDRSLPQAVLTVLEEYPNDVVEVPSIIDTIFVDDIPKQARLSARDRLSNVLSVGLKNRKWYRGKTGHYSVSKDAAAASIA